MIVEENMNSKLEMKLIIDELEYHFEMKLHGYVCVRENKFLDEFKEDRSVKIVELEDILVCLMRKLDEIK